MIYKKIFTSIFLAFFLSLCCGAEINDKAQRYMELGKYVSRFSDYERAAMHFESALKESPDSKVIMYTLGALYQKVGNTASAEVVYKKLIIKYPKEAQAYFALGNVALAERQMDIAIKYYQQAIKLDEKNSYFYRNLGYVAIQTGVPEMAIDYLNKSIELNPTNNLAYFDLATAYDMRGDKAKAHALMQYALKINSDSEGRIAYTEMLNRNCKKEFEQGLAAYKSSNLPAAVKIFSKIAKDYPDYAEAQAYLGHSLNHQKPALSRQAEVAYRAALKARKRTVLIGTEYVIVLDNLGMICINRGDFAEAEALFKIGVKEETDYPVVFFNYGCMLARRENYALAAVAFFDAIKRDKRLTRYLEYHAGLKPFRQTDIYTNLLNSLKGAKLNGK